MGEGPYERLTRSPLQAAPRSPAFRIAVAVLVSLALVTIGVVLWSQRDGDDPLAGEPADAGPTQPPPSLVLHAQAVDPATGTLALVGGARPLQGARPGELEDGTWLRKDGVWTEVDVDSQPSARAGHALAPIGADRFLLFGGSDGRLQSCGTAGLCGPDALGDTWILDAGTASWRRLDLEGPEPRFGAAMAFDEQSGVIVLFGGGTRSRPGGVAGEGEFGDTWLFEPETSSWTAITPDPSPPARAWHRMTYAPALDRILLFGGGAGGGGDDRVWSFDVDTETWSAHQALGPSSRWTSGLTWDAAAERLVVIGGHGPVTTPLGAAGTTTRVELLADIWLFDPVSGTWEERFYPFEFPAPFTPASWLEGKTQMHLFGELVTYDALADEWAVTETEE